MTERMKQGLSGLYEDDLRVERVCERKVDGETVQEYETVYKNARCRASFLTEAAPDDADRFGEMRYRVKLFHGPEIMLKPGDRLAVLKAGRVYTGVAGDSAVYPTHAETVFAVHKTA